MYINNKNREHLSPWLEASTDCFAEELIRSLVLWKLFRRLYIIYDEGRAWPEDVDLACFSYVG